MPYHYLLAALALAQTGCGLITFDVERDIPEQRVPGNIVSVLLDGLFENPIPLEVDLEQETAARDTGPACAAHVTELTFTITNDETFDFVESIAIRVESRKPNSALSSQIIASLDTVPRGAKHLSLNIHGVDLLPYIDEGARITSSASGSPPARDVTFVGHYVVEVEAI